jgi:hypothetical protein
VLNCCGSRSAWVCGLQSADRKKPRADAHGIRQLHILVEKDPDRDYAHKKGEQHKTHQKGELNRRLASLAAGAGAGVDTFTQGANSHTHS